MADGAEDERYIEEEFKVSLIHGSEKYELRLKVLSATVGELAQNVYQLTKVPKERQRLIWKGRSLTNYNQSLQDIGLRNHAKILLIGKKQDSEEEKQIMSISKIEKKVTEIEETFVAISTDFQSTQQGFLTTDMLEESIKRLQKRIKLNEEQLMKAVETLDAMILDATFQEAKTKKKTLTDKILKLHDDAEKLGQSISEYRKNGKK